MEYKNLLNIAIMLTVGVILAGSLLMPVISDAQNDLGDPVTYTNSGAGNGGAIFEEIKDTPIVYTISNSGIKIGDRELTWSVASNWPVIVYTDGGNLNVRYTLDQVHLDTYNKQTNTTVSKSITVGEGDEVTATVENNTITVGSYSLEFTKGYYWSAETSSDKSFLALDLTIRPGTWYVNGLNDLTAWGIYSTGENDCYYVLENGTLTVDEDYTTGVNATLTKVNGTSDIYQLTNFSLAVGEESFTPFLCLIPGSTQGHATAGASYSLLGAIPVMVIIGLVLAATAAIFARRND